MRSKEVDKNIIVFKTERDLLIGGHNLKTTDEYSRLNLAEMYTSILNYIEELEKQIPTPSNEVPLEYQTDIWVNKRDAVMKDKIRDAIEMYGMNLETIDYREEYVIEVKEIEKLLGE